MSGCGIMWQKPQYTWGIGMSSIFLKILEMNLAGSVCILIVLALRMLLRRKPRSFSYVLWAVVFLRLLCPFTLESRYFGLALGNMEQRLETAAYEQELVRYQVLVHKDGTVESSASRGRLDMPDFFSGIPGHYQGVDRVSADSQNQKEQISRQYSRSEVLFQERKWVAAGSLIWAAGVAVLLGYSLASYLLLRGRLRQAVRIQEDVYESDRISTPFLLGIFDPRIYLPVGLPQEERAYVLAHELAHLKRGDYLVKAVTWLTLSLHWFNPLVWLAYGLMVRDMEMSCDERVIRRLGEGSKKAYSKALLTISGTPTGGLGRKILTAAPLSFGENDIRSRVKNILAYRSVKIGTGVVLAVLLAVAGVVLMTDWKVAGADGSEPVSGEEQPAEEPMGGLEDADNGQNYRLDIYYGKENLALDSVYLVRESDGDMLRLYSDRTAAGKGIYRNTEIAAFRQDIRQLGDWVSEWELPHAEQVQVGAYQADVLDGGVLFGWKEENRDLDEAWAPDEWKSAGGFARLINDRQDGETFAFDNKGRLVDLDLHMNHTSINGNSEVVEGCREQAVLVSMNHDLYTVSQLDELEEAGRPVPEEETTVDIWYIGFAREDAPYGYVLFLAQRYYTREEAIATARSIRFTEEAWAAE